MKLRFNFFIALALTTLILGGIACNNSSGSSLNAIVVTPYSATYFLGATNQFTATGLYADGSSADLTSQVTWSSSNTAVASIAETGMMTSVGAGTTILSASFNSVTSNTPTLSVILNFAAGYSKANVTNSGLLPLAYSSNDVGNTWSLLPAFSLPAGQEQGVLNQIHCIENNCVAVGLTFQDPAGNYLPVAYTSNNAGSSWTLIDDFELPSGQAQGTINNVTCVGDVCIGVGQSYDNNTLNELPLVYTSSDSGNTWTLGSALALPIGQTAGLNGDVSCQANICTMIGFSFDNTFSNFLPSAYTSSDSGSTWTLSAALDLPDGQSEAQMISVTCEDTHCVAVGHSFNTVMNVRTDIFPLVYTSSDSGSTWTFLSPFELPKTSGQLNDIFCQANYCVTVGLSFNTLNVDSSPLAYTSSDAGNTWELVPAFALPAGQAQGLLSSVSCADNVCIAQGGSFISDDVNTLPLVYTSSDYGNTWDLSPALTLPAGQTQGLFE